MTEHKNEHKHPVYSFIGTTERGGKVVARVMDETQMDSGVTIDSLRSAVRMNQFNFHALKGLHLMDMDTVKLKLSEAKVNESAHNIKELTNAKNAVEHRSKLKPFPGTARNAEYTASA